MTNEKRNKDERIKAHADSELIKRALLEALSRGPAPASSLPEQLRQSPSSAHFPQWLRLPPKLADAVPPVLQDVH
jgi:hypothetical protein